MKKKSEILLVKSPRNMYALMSTIESTSKIELLTDLESLIEETNAEDEAPRDEIKTETLNQMQKNWKLDSIS